MDYDGLNNVTYKVSNVAHEPLYTIITVDLPGPKTKTEIVPFFKTTHEKLKRLYKSRRQRGLERGQLGNSETFNSQIAFPFCNACLYRTKSRAYPAEIQSDVELKIS